jgi:hypothetical protein
MGQGPPAPLGSFRDRPPAGTCRHARADRCSRLLRTVLPRFTPFAASAVPKAVVWATQSHSIRASCSARRLHTQTPALSALACRLFPHSPPNPTFAPLAEYRGLPATRMAKQGVVARISNTDAYACTQPAQPVNLLAKPRATGRCEARDAVLTERRRRCAHPAPILPYSGPTMRLGCQSSLGLCRSLPPLAFDLEKSPDIVGARRKARASRLHPTSSWHSSRNGMGLLCAQKVLATSGIFGS